MVVKMHFCGSSLSSWTVNEETANCCCESESDNKKSDDDCCDDKSVDLKISDTQQHANKIQLQLDGLQIALPTEDNYFVFDIVRLQQKTAFTFSANAPPEGLWQNIPLFKLHHQFTYYG